MSDQTRRLICRAIFILGCLLPTAGVFGWAMSYHLPGSHSRLEKNLSRMLGMQISFKRVSHPQPGMTLYEEVALADAELGTPLADLDKLQVMQDGNGETFLAEQVNLTEAGGPVFWNWLQENLCQSQASVWEFHAEHVRFSSSGKSYPLANFRARTFSALSGTSATVLFQTRAGGKVKEDVQLKIARNRQASPATTAWELETGQSVLPLGVMRVLLPSLIKLGADADFKGTLTVSHTGRKLSESESGWGCDVSGVLDQVSLQHLTDGLFPGMLEGMARVEIEQAQIRDGRLISASALVTGGPGRISGLLALAGAEAFELAAGTPGTQISPDQMQAYERLGLALGMNARGLLLRGICENSIPGTLLGTMNGPLLRTQHPEHPLQPVAGLLQLTSPTATNLAPATLEMQELARVLPLPTVGHRRVER